MNKSLASVGLIVLLLSPLSACTVSGPEVRIRPPIYIDVEVTGDNHHHRHHHHHDD